MVKKQKYYVVWKGVNPGVYDSWTDCQLQIKGYDGAQYKSFETKEEAEHALASSAFHYIGKNAVKKEDVPKQLPENFDMNCLAVDAACSGNPGPMEYRGVYLLTGQEVFHFGPVYGTNNIGEFLAIVHALALMKQKNINMPVYSDSRNALSWVKQKKCKTKLLFFLSRIVLKFLLLFLQTVSFLLRSFRSKESIGFIFTLEII